ncbi:hypothetical protein AVEN_178831-1 [Araneus ventricosus]|uniref:Uncharacterized protein n=1 Tax=Araneus ventricosus TaxID=182803 RepID=A0A4Y2BGH9_ARAVE|nr:hypothetical protein AVEN_178831-1 [Araneus ventricosus]
MRGRGQHKHPSKNRKTHLSSLTKFYDTPPPSKNTRLKEEERSKTKGSQAGMSSPFRSRTDVTTRALYIIQLQRQVTATREPPWEQYGVPSYFMKAGTREKGEFCAEAKGPTSPN